MIVLACCAGAPFLVLEAQGAKANLAVAVGVMTLLMVVTIFYLPLVLPLLLAGVEVDALSIARSLIVLMLIRCCWACWSNRTRPTQPKTGRRS